MLSLWCCLFCSLKCRFSILLLFNHLLSFFFFFFFFLFFGDKLRYPFSFNEFFFSRLAFLSNSLIFVLGYFLCVVSTHSWRFIMFFVFSCVYAVHNFLSFFQYSSSYVFMLFHHFNVVLCSTVFLLSFLLLLEVSCPLPMLPFFSPFFCHFVLCCSLVVVFLHLLSWLCRFYCLYRLHIKMNFALSISIFCRFSPFPSLCCRLSCSPRCRFSILLSFNHLLSLFCLFVFFYLVI